MILHFYVKYIRKQENKHIKIQDDKCVKFRIFFPDTFGNGRLCFIQHDNLEQWYSKKKSLSTLLSPPPFRIRWMVTDGYRNVKKLIICREIIVEQDDINSL